MRPFTTHSYTRERRGSARLRAERQVPRVVLCRDDEAGGVLVYAVDYARTPLSADAGEGVPAVVHQRVDKRAVGVARRWVYDHAARLVHDDYVPVLVNDVKRDVLAP